MTDSDHYERSEAMEMAQDEMEEMRAKLAKLEQERDAEIERAQSHGRHGAPPS